MPFLGIPVLFESLLLGVPILLEEAFFNKAEWALRTLLDLDVPQNTSQLKERIETIPCKDYFHAHVVSDEF